MKTQTPKISVIIPTYNDEHFIHEAIDSVYAQTLQPFEIIVIDNGSDDNTASIVKERFPDIIVKYCRKRGVAAARNVGVKAAKGDYIANLDADDIWFPKKLELQAALCSLDTIVGTQAQNWRGDHLATMTWSGPVYPDTLADSISELLVSGGQIPGSSWIVPKKAIEEVGYFNETLRDGSDHELFARVLLLGYRMRFAKERLVMRRLHPASLHASGYMTGYTGNWYRLLAFRVYVQAYPERIHISYPDPDQMLAMTLWRFSRLALSDIIYRAPFKWWLPFQGIGTCIMDALIHPFVWKGVFGGIFVYITNSKKRRRFIEIIRRWAGHRRYLRELKVKKKAT